MSLWGNLLDQIYIMHDYKIKVQVNAERKQQHYQRTNRKTALNKKHNLVRK